MVIFVLHYCAAAPMDRGTPLSLPREEPATSLKSRKAMRRERDTEKRDPNTGPSTAAAQKPKILSRSLCLNPNLCCRSLLFLEAIRVEIKGPVVVQEILIWFKRNCVAVVKIPLQKETSTLLRLRESSSLPRKPPPFTYPFTALLLSMPFLSSAFKDT